MKRSTPFSLVRHQLNTTKQQVTRCVTDKAGMGLVGAMLILSLLAIFALVIAGLASNESKTTVNEFVHLGSYMAADSGGEAAIGWIRSYIGAPPILDMNVSNKIASENELSLREHQRFTYQIDHSGFIDSDWGDGVEYPRHWYDVTTEGGSGAKGNSNVRLVVSKKVVQGY